MDKNLHLDSVVKTHQITKEEQLLSKHKEKNKEVKEALEKNYGENIYSPFNSGSYAKNTAINIKFDFDLVSPFKRNAFGSKGTLKEMYEDVFKFLFDKYNHNGDIVIRQKVSIGITFKTDAGEIKIDVVPGREFNQDQYKDDQNLNLYVYKKYGLFEEGADRLKTNIEAQLTEIKNRANADKDSIRKIIRLLKVWKHNKGNYPTKSFFLELITLKTFDNKEVSGSLWDKLKIVLEYVRDNVTNESFKLIDPGNSSNDLMDTLESYERENLSNDMKNMLDRIEENDENITTYFPENPKFKEENEDNKKNAALNIARSGVISKPWCQSI
jgi:hypothetical protein